MKKKILTKKSTEEMEGLGYEWGTVSLPAGRNGVYQLECWHNDEYYVVFK